MNNFKTAIYFRRGGSICTHAEREAPKNEPLSNPIRSKCSGEGPGFEPQPAKSRFMGSPQLSK